MHSLVRQWEEAETWYHKSLEVEERLSNETDAADTYHQLGIIAHEQCQWAKAEAWYRKSLEIEERLGNEAGAAITYHQLGGIAAGQRQWAAAETWYNKSLEIRKRLRIGGMAASDYHQLGSIAQKQQRYREAGDLYLRALVGLLNANDPHNAGICRRNMRILLTEADAASREAILERWRGAGLDQADWWEALTASQQDDGKAALRSAGQQDQGKHSARPGFMAVGSPPGQTRNFAAGRADERPVSDTFPPPRPKGSGGNKKD
ncbi:MAG: tetratricopeptide repeat protein [Magnetococcales bacterium]|nr:tetratricopeptide repeat protein [Magnetococcales bacterium]